jgi:hypothetical protein
VEAFKKEWKNQYCGRDCGANQIQTRLTATAFCQNWHQHSLSYFKSASFFLLGNFEFEWSVFRNQERAKQATALTSSYTAATGISMFQSTTTSTAPQDDNNSLLMSPIKERQSHRDIDLDSSGGRISH